MTDNEAFKKIARELERMNDLKELEIFLNHGEWSAKKYSDKQLVVAELLCESVNEKLKNHSYTFKKH